MASDARSGSSAAPTRPLVLIVIDGWGIAEAGSDNAISEAKTPVMDGLWKSCPHTSVEASGVYVGLPEGQIGNSEVGHLNIGAGYTVLQDLPRIDDEIESGAFFKNEALVGAVEHVKQGGPKNGLSGQGRPPRLHLMGLFSDGGVHSHASHVLALVDLAKQHGVSDVQIHTFLDGRDVPPRQASDDLKRLDRDLQERGNARVATVIGRYYAMDRDKRWDRVEKAYRALVMGEGESADSAVAAVEQSYAADTGDEFVKPTVVGDPKEGRVQAGDAVIFFNFRADRARQLTAAFVSPDFDGFQRPEWPHPLHFVTFGEYESGLPVTAVAFPPTLVETPLAKVVSDAGLKQLHVAETEKYAHVTYFLNGGHEQAFPKEDRVLIPSQKVATYDLAPEMSAEGIADATIKGIQDGYPFVALNFANPDMVGHTGVLDAAIKAVETVDTEIGRIAEATKQANGVLVVTADHGNAEEMVDDRGRPKTAHTTNPVPVIISGADEISTVRSGGRLSDVAPTVLQLLGLKSPPGMTAKSLIE